MPGRLGVRRAHGQGGARHEDAAPRRPHDAHHVCDVHAVRPPRARGVPDRQNRPPPTRADAPPAVPRVRAPVPGLDTCAVPGAALAQIRRLLALLQQRRREAGHGGPGRSRPAPARPGRPGVLFRLRARDCVALHAAVRRAAPPPVGLPPRAVGSRRIRAPHQCAALPPPQSQKETRRALRTHERARPQARRRARRAHERLTRVALRLPPHGRAAAPPRARPPQRSRHASPDAVDVPGDGA